MKIRFMILEGGWWWSESKEDVNGGSGRRKVEQSWQFLMMMMILTGVEWALRSTWDLVMSIWEEQDLVGCSMCYRIEWQLIYWVWETFELVIEERHSVNLRVQLRFTFDHCVLPRGHEVSSRWADSQSICNLVYVWLCFINIDTYNK